MASFFFVALAYVALPVRSYRIAPQHHAMWQQFPRIGADCRPAFPVDCAAVATLNQEVDHMDYRQNFVPGV